MTVTALQRLLDYLQRPRDTSSAAKRPRDEAGELSVTQRDCERAAREDPWFLAG
ncbi:hypothetical protein GCM10011348_44780 [Marinobacterium nitratireducens]|uniref:Uncharacterized protein n=1 Tax=Marinobacterium nitratireducens TaxID=518897 RepID=A0A917ZQC3_9GAMM|nr:hypothetical protein GCM10011348_44780 [Marinobacterium nitratireducens]